MMISHVFFIVEKRLPWQANSALSHKIPSLGGEMAVMGCSRSGKFPHIGAPGPEEHHHFTRLHKIQNCELQYIELKFAETNVKEC